MVRTVTSGGPSQTSESSLSSSTARCTMGPRTAYSTFFTAGFMVSRVNTFARADAPFSGIFSLGSPRRVALRPDRALPGEGDHRAGEVGERTPADNSLRPRLKSRTFLADSNCIRVADMLRGCFFVFLLSRSFSKLAHSDLHRLSATYTAGCRSVQTFGPVAELKYRWRGGGLRMPRGSLNHDHTLRRPLHSVELSGFAPRTHGNATASGRARAAPAPAPTLARLRRKPLFPHPLLTLLGLSIRGPDEARKGLRPTDPRAAFNVVPSSPRCKPPHTLCSVRFGRRLGGPLVEL